MFPHFDPTKDLSKAPKQRTKRGLGARPLMESEIKEAQQKSRSAMEAARVLGVSYNTYKKYSRKYGIFEDLKNPDGNGIKKGSISRRTDVIDIAPTIATVLGINSPDGSTGQVIQEVIDD